MKGLVLVQLKGARVEDPAAIDAAFFIVGERQLDGIYASQISIPQKRLFY
ncbi:hypothetical protein QNK12_15045 [Neobacillus cucumis]|nr:hypothetical protein QNK12_15045 [Neobacillus cucumis]